MGPLPRKKTGRRKDRKWRTWKTPNRIIVIGISCMLSLAKPRGQTLSSFWDWCIIWEKQVNAVGKHPSLLTRSSWGCAPSRSACEAGSTTPRSRSGCKSKSYSGCKPKLQSWVISSSIVILAIINRIKDIGDIFITSSPYSEDHILSRMVWCLQIIDAWFSVSSHWRWMPFKISFGLPHMYCNQSQSN